jgi:hypothetical protein
MTVGVQECEADAFFFEDNFVLKDELFEFKEGLRNGTFIERGGNSGTTADRKTETT